MRTTEAQKKMASKKKKSEQRTLDPQQVPEVVSFMTAEQELQAFIATNPAFYKRLSDLVEERNVKLEAAEKVVRAHRASCGPFHFLNTKRVVDPEVLFNELGEDNFKLVGGYTEQRTHYAVDKDRFFAYVDTNQIPKPVIDVSVKEQPSFRVIPVYKLP